MADIVLIGATGGIGSRLIPMLIRRGHSVTGLHRKPEQAEELRDAIDEKGGEVTLVTYKDIDHVETVGSFMWFWRYKSDIRDKLLYFFNEQKAEAANE